VVIAEATHHTPKMMRKGDNDAGERSWMQ